MHARRQFAWPRVRVSSSLIADSSTKDITRTRTTSSPSCGVLLLRFVATETCGARVLVAADGVGMESETLAAEDIGPKSEVQAYIAVVIRLVEF